VALKFKVAKTIASISKLCCVFMLLIVLRWFHTWWVKFVNVTDFLRKLVEILFKACAIGNKVLFDKIIEYLYKLLSKVLKLTNFTHNVWNHLN